MMQLSHYQEAEARNIQISKYPKTHWLEVNLVIAFVLRFAFIHHVDMVALISPSIDGSALQFPRIEESMNFRSFEQELNDAGSALRIDPRSLV